nr:MAG TPA: translation initiation factor IF-1 [Caudoviricetes sp.]
MKSVSDIGITYTMKGGERMSKADLLELEGVVEELYPGSKFLVTINQEEGKESPKHQVVCTLSGKLRKNHIKVILGDRVTINVSPYDLTKGIIAWRHK